MTTHKKQFKAALIKYRDAQMENVVWFWINPTSGATLSPQFDTQKEAEAWFDSVVKVHTETYEFLDRIKNGKLYTVKGRVDIGDLISSKKANDCPFTMHLDEDILSVEVLATSVDDAKVRAKEYLEILEWIE